MPRNSSGIYTLPAGNPVVPDTVIETEWANPTLADIAQALTDSLDRNGRGNMLAPFKFTDGTAAAPAISFSSEPSSGLYRPGSKTVGVAILGVQVAQWTDTGYTTYTPHLLADGTAALPALGVTSEVGTGVFRPTASALAVSIVGTERARFSATGFSVTGDASVSGALSANTLTVAGALTSGSVAGAAILPAGALATPSLSFAGDSDTGLFSPAPGVVAMVTDGVERMRWDAVTVTNTVPPGAMMDYGGNAAPAGWLVCDGAAVSRITYAALFAAIGTLWGAGDGSTTFNLPDFRRRVAVGAGGAATAGPGAAVGNVGGAETITLTVANMPSHTHAVNDPTHAHAVADPGHQHISGVPHNDSVFGVAATPAVNGKTGVLAYPTSPVTDVRATGIGIYGAATGISVAATGGGAAFAAFQPSATVNKIIKT